MCIYGDATEEIRKNLPAAKALQQVPYKFSDIQAS